MAKVRVGVMRGGPSSEYEVSINSGGSVLKALAVRADRYQARDIFISKKGVWHMDGLERTPEQIFRNVDVIINAMHGEFGEDGTVQRLLDAHQVAYTGSKALSSALAMNKVMTKKIAKQHGVKTAIWTTVKREDFERDTHGISVNIFRTFPHPAVVKPVAAGSSVGVSIARTHKELVAGLEKALKYSDTALVEEYIAGREATVGVINDFRGYKIYSLPPVEILKPEAAAFFDYEAKYGGASTEICPGNFTRDESEHLQAIAKKVHDALGLDHYSRSDFIVSPRRGIYFLEANTLPGLTDQSLLPKALDAVGCSLPDFVDHLVGLALAGK